MTHVQADHSSVKLKIKSGITTGLLATCVIIFCVSVAAAVAIFIGSR